MNPLSNSPGKTLRALWRGLRPLPGGRLVFSKLVGAAAPYTGTIGARVVDVGPGYAKIVLRDRRRVRNHLASVHAVALVNLAEMTTGLAMSMGMPDDARGILKGMSIEYLKKARGRLTAECKCEVPASNARRELAIEGTIRNDADEIVARATAHWLVGPSR
jgi:acyl-coenzyme A thioesterase PaaI-like protein